MWDCPNCDESRPRKIAGYSYDNFIQFWVCLTCGHRWNRWPPEDPRWRYAQRIMHNVQVGGV